MNIIYLLHILETNKITELVQNIDLPPIDINLALWDAQDSGQVEIDKEKDYIAPLKIVEPSCDEALANKLIRVIQHYASEETNVTRGILNTVVKDPMGTVGYPWHEYIMALQWLIDTKQVIEYEVPIPKTKDHPDHKFVFLGLSENKDTNEEWNAREVNKWLAKFKNKKVQ